MRANEIYTSKYRWINEFIYSITGLTTICTHVLLLLPHSQTNVNACEYGIAGVSDGQLINKPEIWIGRFNSTSPHLILKRPDAFFFGGLIQAERIRAFFFEIFGKEIQLKSMESIQISLIFQCFLVIFYDVLRLGVTLQSNSFVRKPSHTQIFQTTWLPHNFLCRSFELSYITLYSIPNCEMIVTLYALIKLFDIVANFTLYILCAS